MQPEQRLPRYEDVIYERKENVPNQKTFMPEPPAVLTPTAHPPAMQPTVQPPTVQPPTVQALKVPILETSSVKVILNVVNTLTHFFLGAVVFSAFMIANAGQIRGETWSRDQTSFRHHIYLCVIGYVILFSHAILSLSPHGGWAHGLKHPQKQVLYGIMHILGSSLALAGCLVKITDWEYYPMSNSGHVVFGWIAMILTFLSLIGGLLNLQCPEKIQQFREGRYKHCPEYLFKLTLVTAFICLCCGFSDSYHYFNEYVNSALSITFTVFALLGILITAATKIKE